MARVKLQMPENFPFKTQIDVRITDINYGNHLGNDSLLSIIHEARVRFLKQYGYSEMNIEGLGTMMADVVIIYKTQSYYGECLTIEMGVGEVLKKSCDLYYRISKAENTIVAFCKTTIVFYDYQNEKPAQIPDSFIRKIMLNNSPK